MGEYCITKIIDGLFISDSLVPLVPFSQSRTFPFSAETRSSAQLDGRHSNSLFSQKTMTSLITYFPRTKIKLDFPTIPNLRQGFGYCRRRMKNCYAA